MYPEKKGGGGGGWGERERNKEEERRDAKNYSKGDESCEKGKGKGTFKYVKYCQKGESYEMFLASIGTGWQYPQLSVSQIRQNVAYWDRAMEQSSLNPFQSFFL